MIKQLIFLISILCLYSAPKAQLQMFQAQDLQIIQFKEISNHIFVIAHINNNDSCTYFFIITVSNDFYIISGSCRGDESVSRYISDDDLKNLLDQDSEERKEQQHPEKQYKESKQQNTP